MKHLLEFTAERAWRYRQSLHDRTVAPTPEAVADLRRLDEPLPEAPTDPEAVIALLWDVETRGLFGAPPINVVVSEHVHVSVLKALALLGLGRERVIRAPVDGQGRIRSDALPRLDAGTILCLQAGDVNTGAFDPAAEIIPRAHAAGAWVHVDGAFGLWAAAAPARAQLINGFADADSWP